MNTTKFWDDLDLADSSEPVRIHTVGALLGAVDESFDAQCRQITAWLTRNEPSETLIASIGASRYGKPVFWHPTARSA